MDVFVDASGMVTVTESDVVVMSNDNADSGSVVSTTFVPDITTETFGCGDQIEKDVGPAKKPETLFQVD